MDVVKYAFAGTAGIGFGFAFSKLLGLYRETVYGDDDFNLQQVQVFFRHGARTPLSQIPNVEEGDFSTDKVRGSLVGCNFPFELTGLNGGPPPFSVMENHYQKLGKMKGGCAYGMLTSLGSEQAYELGKSLRGYVNRFTIPFQKKGLLDDFNPEYVYIRSTNMNRTVNSLRSVLGGLFTEKTLHNYCTESGKKIRIHIATPEEEHLYPNPHVCPLLKQINHAAVIHGGDLPEFRGDKEKIEEVLGLNKDHDKDRNGDQKKHKFNFIAARDNLVSRKEHEVEIPDVIKPFMDMIDRNATTCFSYSFVGQDKEHRKMIKKMSAGRMLNLVFTNINDLLNSNTKYKMCLYSAHDSSLMALLLALDISDGKWPPYSSSLVFELYQNAKVEKYYVCVTYNGQPTILPTVADKYITSKRGNRYLPLDTFMTYLKNDIVVNEKEYKSVCNSTIEELLAQEKLYARAGEADDEETQELSDKPAGM